MRFQGHSSSDPIMTARIVSLVHVHAGNSEQWRGPANSTKTLSLTYKFGMWRKMELVTHVMPTKVAFPHTNIPHPQDCLLQSCIVSGSDGRL
ncbi:hypothetical protein J6590_010401 [Homalodisca vitripennis]|nr:hypothetical protein J6590_010401 [Homalodisca vitripennis]